MATMTELAVDGEKVSLTQWMVFTQDFQYMCFRSRAMMGCLRTLRARFF